MGSEPMSLTLQQLFFGEAVSIGTLCGQMCTVNSILIGDFNMPDIDWETWTGARNWAGFLDAVEDALLEQMVYFPTHIKGNCLDLVLTNIPERIKNVEEMGRLGASDHEMILVTVAMQGGREETEKNGLNLIPPMTVSMSSLLERLLSSSLAS